MILREFSEISATVLLEATSSLISGAYLGTSPLVSIGSNTLGRFVGGIGREEMFLFQLDGRLSRLGLGRVGQAPSNILTRTTSLAGTYIYSWSMRTAHLST
jgi:hypothetical protein